MTSQKLVVKGKYRSVWHDTPIELEWELPIECYDDVEVFEKIGEEMRRIAWTLKKQEEREFRRRCNIHWQNYALANLRWLFVPRPEIVEVKP